MAFLGTDAHKSEVIILDYRNNISRKRTTIYIMFSENLELSRYYFLIIVIAIKLYRGRNMPPYITYLLYGVDLSRHTGESVSIHCLTGNRRKTLVRGNPIGHPTFSLLVNKSRKENPQKLTQLSSRSHPRHLLGKRTAQKDITIDTTSDSQVNSNFPNRWSPASLTFNNYFTYFYIYI